MSRRTWTTTRTSSCSGRPRPAPSGLFQRWRRGVGALFRDTLGSREAAVLSALIIGTDTTLPPDLRDAFSRAGVSHVLSISGLHIGLVASTGYAVFRWLLARSEWLLLAAHVPKLAAMLSVAPVLAYAAIAGGNVATIRAVIMVLVFLGAALVDRQRDILVSLAAAAVLILLSAPGSAADISFQLSFAAVLGLTLGLERFWPWWLAWEERHLLRLRGRRMRWWRTVALSAAVTTSALAATMPLTAYHFNQLSLVAPLANAVVVPVLGSAAVGLGLVAALVWPLSVGAATAITWTAGWCVTLGVRLVEALAALPGAAVRVVTPTGLELALAYGALLGALLLRGRRRAATLGLLAVVALADGTAWWWDRHHRADLRITFLSVGHGDSAVIEFPGSAVMVLDGGGVGDGSFDPGARVIAPFLWSRKIARLDHLVLSHPQADHFGGLGFLATQFAPHDLWSSGLQSDAARYRAFLQDVERAGMRRLQLRQGDHRRIGTVAIDALWPERRPTHDGARRHRRQRPVARAAVHLCRHARAVHRRHRRPHRADARHLLRRRAAQRRAEGAAPRQRHVQYGRLPRRRRAAPGGRVVRMARPVPPAPAGGVGPLRGAALPRVAHRSRWRRDAADRR